jgi:hypothetical protein
MLNRRRFITTTGAAGAALALPIGALAQPDKAPIRILIGFPPAAPRMPLHGWWPTACPPSWASR